MNMIAIEESLLERFHRLASETHRPEAEIIEEALSLYINNDAQYVEVLRQRMDAAERGEFASEQQVSHFFNPSLTRYAPISLFYPHRHPASPAKPLDFG
jgi:predicted transcriptional regulator